MAFNGTWRRCSQEIWLKEYYSQDEDSSNLEDLALEVKEKTDKILPKIKALEDQLKKAKVLNCKLKTFESSADFLTSLDISSLQRVLSDDAEKLKKSEVIKNEIKDLERRLQQLKTSEDLLSDEQTTHLTNKREEASNKLSKNMALTSNISRIKTDSAFLPEEEMTKLEENIKQVKQKIGINQVTNQQENFFEEKHNCVQQELVCTICFDVPKVNIEIYSCEQQHLMCGPCKIRWFKTCPVCRQNFQMTPPKRNRLIESIIQSLN